MNLQPGHPRDVALRTENPGTVVGEADELALIAEHAPLVQAVASGVSVVDGEERWTVIAAPPIVVAYGPSRRDPAAPRVVRLPAPDRVWTQPFGLGSAWRLQLVYADRVVTVDGCRRDAARAVAAVISR